MVLIFFLNFTCIIQFSHYYEIRLLFLFIKVRNWNLKRAVFLKDHDYHVTNPSDFKLAVFLQNWIVSGGNISTTEPVVDFLNLQLYLFKKNCINTRHWFQKNKIKINSLIPHPQKNISKHNHSMIPHIGRSRSYMLLFQQLL